MKKLSLYAMVISILISLLYSFKVYWMIDTEMQFWRATAITLVSEIGLWCAYYYARDYEACKAHEAHQNAMRKSFENAMNKLGKDQ